MERIEFLVEDSISKILKAWKDGEEKLYVSFSGGKDSTVLYHLIKMANIPAKIVFFDTGIELDVIYEFVKTFNDVEWVKPRKPFGQIVKQYGIPYKSKFLSEYLHTWDINQKNPFKLVRNNELVKGTIHRTTWEGDIVDTKEKITTGRALPKKNFHMLHPDRVGEYTVHNRCCAYLKKDPSKHYIKEHNVNGYFMGVRQAEGGARSLTYKSCRSVKKIGKKLVLQSMPMFDWSDQDVDDFIKKYNIPISKAYTEYGLERTGCFCCPFAQKMDENLEALYKYETNKYKASMKWLGKVYMDMGVDLPFDENYQKEKMERDKINESRRQEMLEKYGRV
jgi:3'-phosphoadenosine 5'-phosphosulfate sulfotransferase (PAPS reductase)/FAD synthetase